MKIGISISDPGEEELARQGMTSLHLQDAMVETARYLLHAGHTLIYGGDLTFHGGFNFTELLFQLNRAHGGRDRIINYSAFPLYTKITVQREAELLPIAEIIRVNPSPEFEKWTSVRYENVSEIEREYLDNIFDNMTPETKAIWAESLTEMRKQMTENIQCRIVMGGKTQNYKGSMPGIWEETLLCIENNVTVYVDGRFGGAAREIVNTVNEKTPTDIYGLGKRIDVLKNGKVEAMIDRVICFKGKETFPEINNLFKLL